MSEKTKRILVTGCLGFIGHNFVKAALKRGYAVVGVDNLSTGDRERLKELVHPEFVFIQADVNSLQPLGPIDLVFHFAAIPRVPVSFDDPRRSLINNIDSTVEALEIARLNKCPIVYSSSSSIYGDQEVTPLFEDMTPHPQSPYAISKLIGEQLCEHYYKIFDVKYVALRYFNVYGPGMTRGGYATAISTFLDQVSNGQPLTLVGDGSQSRDFTHVDDVIQANMLAGEFLSGNHIGIYQSLPHIFNIGAGQPRSILSVAKMIGDNIEHLEPRREPRRTHADNRLAGRVLNWHPQKNFETELNKLIDLWPTPTS